MALPLSASLSIDETRQELTNITDSTENYQIDTDTTYRTSKMMHSVLENGNTSPTKKGDDL